MSEAVIAEHKQCGVFRIQRSSNYQKNKFTNHFPVLAAMPFQLDK